MSTISSKPKEYPTVQSQLDNLKNLVLHSNLQSDMDIIGKEVWSKKINLDGNKSKLKHILHSQLANFPDYIEKTSGKITQISITVSEYEMLIRVFSYNGATKEIIDQKFEEFANFSGAKDIEEALKYVKYVNKVSIDQKNSNELLWGMQKQSFDFNLKIAEKFENINLQNHELTKILLDKFPENSSVLNLQNNTGNITFGNHNSQGLVIQNQPEFVDQLLQIADILAQQKKLDLLPSQLHYIEKIESEIKELKSKPVAKATAKTWLENLEKYISVGGALVALSEKIAPIVQELFKLAK
jgi:hypothetical protein